MIAPAPAAFAVLAGATLLAASTALARGASAPYGDGAPPAHTGGFGEPSCTACHYDHPLDDTSGALDLGLPAAWKPGASYDMEIRLRHPQMRRGGFQLAARWLDGTKAGRQAGALASADSMIDVIRQDSTGVQFAGHREARPVGRDSASAKWTLRWTAPATGAGPVAVDIAANAANGDYSSFGDRIYVRRVVIPRSHQKGSVEGRKDHDQRVDWISAHTAPAGSRITQ